MLPPRLQKPDLWRDEVTLLSGGGDCGAQSVLAGLKDIAHKSGEHQRKAGTGFEKKGRR